jgi:TonB family protein
MTSSAIKFSLPLASKVFTHLPRIATNKNVAIREVTSNWRRFLYAGLLSCIAHGFIASALYSEQIRDAHVVSPSSGVAPRIVPLGQLTVQLTSTQEQLNAFHAVTRNTANLSQQTSRDVPADVSTLPPILAPVASTAATAGSDNKAISTAPPRDVTLSSYAKAAEYRLAKDVDKKPALMDDIQLTYPPGVDQIGAVTLRLFISQTGDVDNLEVVSASPAGIFEEAAIQAFKNARFAPGRILGIPVKTQVTFTVDFERYNRGSNVSTK